MGTDRTGHQNGSEPEVSKEAEAEALRAQFGVTEDKVLLALQTVVDRWEGDTPVSLIHLIGDNWGTHVIEYLAWQAIDTMILMAGALEEGNGK